MWFLILVKMAVRYKSLIRKAHFFFPVGKEILVASWLEWGSLMEDIKYKGLGAEFVEVFKQALWLRRGHISILGGSVFLLLFMLVPPWLAGKYKLCACREGYLRPWIFWSWKDLEITELSWIFKELGEGCHGQRQVPWTTEVPFRADRQWDGQVRLGRYMGGKCLFGIMGPMLWNSQHLPCWNLHHLWNKGSKSVWSPTIHTPESVHRLWSQTNLGLKSWAFLWLTAPSPHL